MGSLANIQLAPVLSKLAELESSYDTQRLARAYAVAQSAYGDSLHWTGEKVLDHVLGILGELAPFEPDEDTVVACLLHHVLESKALTLAELEEDFGPKVRMLVSGVHLLSHVTLEGRRRSTEDLRIMLLSVSDDIRVLFVSLCDRVHCLKFVTQVEPSRAKRLCQDVVQLFAPVAARLGIYTLKHRLEQGAFPTLYPSDSERILEQLEMTHKEHPQYLAKAQQALESFLVEQGIDAAVESREKQPFSIFHKMQNKALTHVDDIYDLFALRVIVATEEDCYRALGLLHRLGRPMANRFKDYIAFPKPNGYQSLHTTIAGFAGLEDSCFMEVQVRTQKMHREAKFGVAAHWSYKEHGATDRAIENVQLHSLLVGQESVDDSVGGSALADHIFVLTPRGDIIELPEGATPLDFAFQVHTELGLSFRSARVNRSIVSLDYELENGDVVEIQKHSSPSPSPQWMQMLKMGSSRSKLRRYLYAQDRPHLVSLGKEMVNEELKKRSLPQLTTDLSVMRVCDGNVLNFSQREDVLMKIGQGAERAAALMLRLEALQSTKQVAPKAPPTTDWHPMRSTALVTVEGGVTMPTRYAKCCEPDQWPREDIAGNINREGKVMIHRHHCRMYSTTNPERRVKVWWQ